MRFYTSTPAPTKLAPTLPSISVSMLNISNLVLNWGVPAQLLSATNLVGINGWTAVTPTNTYGPYTSSITGGQQYFRLKLQ